MKAEGKYRFNLQFSDDSEKQVQVGEFLERAGNRKSAVIVDALYEYLQKNPDLLRPEVKIQIQSTPRFDRREIEQMIRGVVAEYFKSEQLVSGYASLETPEDDMDDDISQMLDNLDLFQ